MPSNRDAGWVWLTAVQDTAPLSPAYAQFYRPGREMHIYRLTDASMRRLIRCGNARGGRWWVNEASPNEMRMTIRKEATHA